ncbi:HNH endonuclease [Bacillus sp. FJAT-27445]|uniref:HNH endonuclease n=1 Tax=Bacillus sp. FJAT-27445 TaxID=1679166 RepID=UPI000743E77E|nr:HNH endonuclease [Bacillus sp. FJAT-27445]
MKVFRTIGKGLGTVGGGVVGGSIRVVGKAVGTKWKGTGEWIEEIGDGVESASKIALDNAGQFVDGAIQGTYGAIKSDDYYKQRGLNDLKDSTGRTLNGIGSSVKYTMNNIGTTYKGFKSGNNEEAIKGMKNLGKVVDVSAFAIGIVDIVDGADVIEAEELETRNDHLGGYEHPDTGVLFVERAVDLPNGQVIEGVFPVFDSNFNVVLAEELYLESDEVHFKVANDTLYQAVSENPSLAGKLGLSNADVQSLANGQTPEGFTWHHNEEPGRLQLVDEDTHAQTAHTGGRAIWGGGSEYR